MGQLELSQYLISSMKTIYTSEIGSLFYFIELSLVVLSERMVANAHTKEKYVPYDPPSCNTLMYYDRHAQVDGNK